MGLKTSKTPVRNAPGLRNSVLEEALGWFFAINGLNFDDKKMNFAILNKTQAATFYQV
jgi:hypothetical protein